MTLLQEIQNAAVDSKTDVATLLRKCKILAVRLGNGEFMQWVDNELNGYKNVENLPEYRVLHTQSFGFFASPVGRGLQNLPIPPSTLPEEFQDLITKSYLMHPISAYSSLVDTMKGDNPKEDWPADLIALHGRRIYRGWNCLSAWKAIPYNALVSLIDTIRTRILNFALEIERESPDAGEAPLDKPPLAQEQVSQVFNTYIIGNVQNIATGSSNLSQTVELSIGEGNLDELKNYLGSKGIKDTDLQELEESIREDSKEEIGKKPGGKVQAWVRKMASKAASGAWNIGTSVAGDILEKALSKYFGL
jgi:hypothetical protein